MKTMQDMLAEAKEGKNVHLEHIEDSIFNGGVNGTRQAIYYLAGLRDMLSGHSEKRYNITTKWDGAPAIIAGVNPENGKFFVGTKGVFAQNGKVNYTESDIDKNHSGEGLNKKLKIALMYLQDLNIRGVIQGDMMYTRDDLKIETIDGQKYVTFHPNTLVYAIPHNSNLARTILNSKIGIVWHTSYYGKTLSDMRASFGVNTNALRPSKNVWFRDASLVDESGTATFTAEETKALNAIMSEIGSIFRNIDGSVLNRIATNEFFKIQIKAWNNTHIRMGQEIKNTGTYVRELTKFLEEKLNKSVLEAKKADTKQKRLMEKRAVLSFFRGHAGQLKSIFDLYNLIVRAKLMIVRKLETIRSLGTFLRTADGGFRVTSPEGFVVVDHLSGNALKLVDRLEFSRANFTGTKSWT